MRRFLFIACLTFAAQATAQGFPSKPVLIVVPFTPGGVTDSARIAQAAGIKAQ